MTLILWIVNGVLLILALGRLAGSLPSRPSDDPSEPPAIEAPLDPVPAEREVQSP